MEGAWFNAWKMFVRTPANHMDNARGYEKEVLWRCWMKLDMDQLHSQPYDDARQKRRDARRISWRFTYRRSPECGEGARWHHPPFGPYRVVFNGAPVVACDEQPGEAGDADRRPSTGDPGKVRWPAQRGAGPPAHIE
jgi:hypothetical protein